MKMTESIEPPATIAITPAAPAGVLPRPSALSLRFLASALPTLLFGRDFLREIDLNLLPPEEQDEVLKNMRPVSASQVRMIVPSLEQPAERLTGPIQHCTL